MRFSEYYSENEPRVADGAISITKVKNLLKRMGGGYRVENGHNIRVNKQLRGSSGFIHREGSDRIVYFNLEPSCCFTEVPYIVRYAKSDDDYTGGTNIWLKWENFADTIEKLFTQDYYPW